MQQTVIGDEYYPGMQVQTDAQIFEVCENFIYAHYIFENRRGADKERRPSKAVSKPSGTHLALARWELPVIRWLLSIAMPESLACKVLESWMQVLSPCCLLDILRALSVSSS
jgi:hypothetical protein